MQEVGTGPYSTLLPMIDTYALGSPRLKDEEMPLLHLPSYILPESLPRQHVGFRC
jgi:hypothetical protein